MIIIISVNEHDIDRVQFSYYNRFLTHAHHFYVIDFESDSDQIRLIMRDMCSIKCHFRVNHIE